MKITINIPDAVAGRVIDGFCNRYHYTDVSSNPKKNQAGKVKFIKQKTIEFIMRAVRDAEIDAAAKVATDAAGTSADTDIILS